MGYIVIQGISNCQMRRDCLGVLQAEKIMKALYVRKLFLWPRFQAVVRANLEDAVPAPADVSCRPSLQMTYCIARTLKDSAMSNP